MPCSFKLNRYRPTQLLMIDLSFLISWRWVGCLCISLIGSHLSMAQSDAQLGAHGLSSWAASGVMADGSTAVVAWGIPFHGTASTEINGATGRTLSVGWLHADVTDLGNDCPADLDNDGVVATNDLLLILASFSCTLNCAVDLNGDGVTSSLDLLILLAAYGDYCG